AGRAAAGGGQLRADAGAVLRRAGAARPARPGLPAARPAGAGRVPPRRRRTGGARSLPRRARLGPPRLRGPRGGRRALTHGGAEALVLDAGRRGDVLLRLLQAALVPVRLGEELVGAVVVLRHRQGVLPHGRAV